MNFSNYKIPDIAKGTVLPMLLDTFMITNFKLPQNPLAPPKRIKNRGIFSACSCSSARAAFLSASVLIM